MPTAIDFGRYHEGNPDLLRSSMVPDPIQPYVDNLSRDMLCVSEILVRAERFNYLPPCAQKKMPEADTWMTI